MQWAVESIKLKVTFDRWRIFMNQKLCQIWQLNDNSKILSDNSIKGQNLKKYTFLTQHTCFLEREHNQNTSLASSEIYKSNTKAIPHKICVFNFNFYYLFKIIYLKQKEIHLNQNKIKQSSDNLKITKNLISRRYARLKYIKNVSNHITIRFKIQRQYDWSIPFTFM